MTYIRKTEDEYEVQADYGDGFEVVTTETTAKAARQKLRDYQTNDYIGKRFRMVKKRVKKEQFK